MFQLRAERLEVSLRRRRRLVAQRVIELAGLTNTPVGVDDAGREFWRFPVSRSIFVCSAATQEQPCPVRRAFEQRLKTGETLSREISLPSSSSAAPAPRVWRRIDLSDLDTLSGLTRALKAKPTPLSANELELYDGLVGLVADALTPAEAAKRAEAEDGEKAKILAEEAGAPVNEEGEAERAPREG